MKKDYMGNKIFLKIFLSVEIKNPRETYKHKVSRGIYIYYISAINSISSTNNGNHFSYKSVVKKNIFFYHSFHAFIISYSTSQQ